MYLDVRERREYDDAKIDESLLAPEESRSCKVLLLGAALKRLLLASPLESLEPI